MLASRKNSKPPQESKLKKSNVLKMNQTNTTYKKTTKKGVQTECQENIKTSYCELRPRGFDHHFASTS